MEAEELRIGNWIHDPKHNKCDFQIEMFMGAHDFQAVTKDFLEDLTLKLDQCEPIPLTEEWLVKFGFKRWGSYTHLWKVKRKHVCTVEEAHDYKGGREFYIYKGRSGYTFEISTVHQLQNLYHALTGEELTLKG